MWEGYGEPRTLSQRAQGGAVAENVFEDKNSPGDEIANVNFCTTISHAHVLQTTKKENLLRLTN